MIPVAYDLPLGESIDARLRGAEGNLASQDPVSVFDNLRAAHIYSSIAGLPAHSSVVVLESRAYAMAVGIALAALESGEPLVAWSNLSSIVDYAGFTGAPFTGLDDVRLLARKALVLAFEKGF